MAELKERYATVLLKDIIEPLASIRMSINPDRIRELAESIKEKGLQQPIVLRQSDPPYEICDGHRRYLAHQFLDMKEIKSVIREMTEEDVAIIRLINNIQHEDLTMVEEGKAYEDLCRRHRLSINALSKKIGRSQTHVNNCIAVLSLPPFVQEALATRAIAFGPINILMRIKDEAQRNMYLRYACENGITKKVAEEWRTGYERMQDEETQRRRKEEIVDPHQHNVVYFTCFSCKRATDLRTMTQLYLCPECYGFIFEGKEKPSVFKQ